MPWANGLGQTVEIIRVEGPDGMLWRLSMASVVADGAFSMFPGIRRNLTVLSGPGFRLRGGGLDLAASPLIPVAFPGDVAIAAQGVTGPSEDFNVMVADILPEPGVWLAAKGDRAVPAATGILCLLALQDGPGIARHDLLISDGAVDVGVPALAVALDVAFPQG